MNYHSISSAYNFTQGPSIPHPLQVEPNELTMTRRSSLPKLTAYFAGGMMTLIALGCDRANKFKAGIERNLLSLNTALKGSGLTAIHTGTMSSRQLMVITAESGECIARIDILDDETYFVYYKKDQKKWNDPHESFEPSLGQIARTTDNPEEVAKILINRFGEAPESHPK